METYSYQFDFEDLKKQAKAELKAKHPDSVVTMRSGAYTWDHDSNVRSVSFSYTLSPKWKKEVLSEHSCTDSLISLKAHVHTLLGAIMMYGKVRKPFIITVTDTPTDAAPFLISLEFEYAEE